MTPLLAVAGQRPGKFIERPGMPKAVCMPTKEPPKIDGVANDPCWQSASPLAIRTLLSNKPLPPTIAKITWDKKGLYVLIQADEPTPDKIRALATKNDSEEIYSDDHVELFFDPDGDGQRGAASAAPSWWGVASPH